MKRRGMFAALFGLPAVAVAPAAAAPREVRLRLRLDARSVAEVRSLQDRLTADCMAALAHEQTRAVAEAMERAVETARALGVQTDILHRTLVAQRVA